MATRFALFVPTSAASSPRLAAFSGTYSSTALMSSAPPLVRDRPVLQVPSPPMLIVAYQSMTDCRFGSSLSNDFPANPPEETALLPDAYFGGMAFLLSIAPTPFSTLAL